ncbi:MAG: mannose-1-phosphate guanylyltransferase/mannose-6-phosphate isomerase [Methyloceanibacter sp.]
MTHSMITPVILAGGSGTRLWPISRETLPKQFCRIGQSPSLFQQTIKRLDRVGRFGAPIIVTNTLHAETVQSQLSDLKVTDFTIICEPIGRDTTAAILVASELCSSDDGSIMMVMPSDHLIEDIDAFTSAIDAGHYVAEKEKFIVTFGVQPTRPETGFGYIRAGSPVINTRSFLIERFLEKPSLPDAEQLIQQTSVYWNAGLFMFDRTVLAQEAGKHAAETFGCIQTAIHDGRWEGSRFYPEPSSFSSITKISFDYAIMEKTRRSAVVPMDPKWSDLGSWAAVWDQGELDSYGNLLSGNVLCRDTENSLAMSDGPMVGVCGVEDIVVVANRDAVLVSSRKGSQGIKALVETIKTRNPELVHKHAGEDRPWGRFDSIDRGKSHQVKRIRVDPGGRLSLQYHHHRQEHWVVVAGVATVTVDGTVKDLKAAEQVHIPKGAVHRLENLTSEPLEIIEVQYGDYLGEDDIVRVEDVYGRDAEPAHPEQDRQAA